MTLPTYTQDGDVLPCTFGRAVPIPNEPLISTYTFIRGTEPPPRIPSSLPPPGDLRMAIVLGDRLGSGRSGVVFAATIDHANSSPELSELVTPPLAVKVSRQGHHESVLHDAFYYEEMECLQGVVIPRYYGSFQGCVSEGASLCQSGDVKGREQLEIASEDSGKEKSNSFCILIMEKLGGLIPVGERLPDKILYVCRNCDSALRAHSPP